MKTNTKHEIFRNKLGLLLIIAALISSTLIANVALAANPPVPTYGHATVDGILSSGEWDLTNDFFADMYRAGDPTKELEAKAYLKYDSNKHIMYVLVLTVPGVPALSTGWEGAAWAAIDSTQNKVYTGSVGNDGVPPDFSWVGLAFDGNSGHALGYEASFSLNPGVYDIIVHIEVFDSAKSQTAATVGFPKTGVLLDVTQIQQPHPAIQVVKFISVDGGSTWIDTSASPGPTSVEQGTNVMFRFNVTNTGDVDLSNVVLTDSILPVSETIPVLAVGQTVSIIPSQTILVTEGLIHQNTATVTGWYNGQGYSDTHDSSFVGVTTAVPSIRMTKYVSVDGGLTWDDANVSPGPLVAYADPIYYKFIVENDGTVALSPVAIVDPSLDFSGVVFPDVLGSGETFECTLGPLEAGLNQQTNTATAYGTFGTTEYTHSDSANYFGTHPEISVDKYVSVDGGLNWINAHELPGPYVLMGQTVLLKFTVTNLGNTPIDQIVLKDTPNIDFGAYPNWLAPGDYFDIIVSVVVVEGQQTDFVTVDGKFGNTPVKDSDEANYFGASPSIQVVKYVSDDGLTWYDSNTSPGIYIMTGNAVYFKFDVENTGNVPLTNIALDDVPVLNLINELPEVLAPGESFTVYSEQSIALEGQQTDTATATGLYAGNAYSNTDVANYFGASPAIQVVKYVSVDNGITWFDANEIDMGPYVLTGSMSIYLKFVVTNTGNVPLNSVTFNDSPNGNYGTYPILNPGASFEIIWGPMTAIQGQQTDTVTAHGHFNKIEYMDSDNGNYFGAIPAIQVIKYVSLNNLTWQDANTAPGLVISKGKTAYFKFVVTNTGNVPLTDITLTDDPAMTFVGVIQGSLAPGESFTVYSSTTAGFGRHTNTATATGYFGNLDFTATSSDVANYYGTLVTYTIGGYAGPGVPGQILSQQWSAISPFEVGYYTATPGFGYRWENTATGLANLKKFLTTTGSPSVITKDVLNPTTTGKTGGGTLATQTAGLTINIRLSGTAPSMPSGFGDLVYINPGDSLSGLTVNQILAIANKALAGQGLPAGYNNYANVNNIVSNLNLAFDNGIPTSWAISYLYQSPP